MQLCNIFFIYQVVFRPISNSDDVSFVQKYILGSKPFRLSSYSKPSTAIFKHCGCFNEPLCPSFVRKVVRSTIVFCLVTVKGRFAQTILSNTIGCVCIFPSIIVFIILRNISLKILPLTQNNSVLRNMITIKCLYLKTNLYMFLFLIYLYAQIGRYQIFCGQSPERLSIYRCWEMFF